jgi:hypothetical protein
VGLMSQSLINRRITHQPPNRPTAQTPFPPTLTLLKFSRFSKSLENSKTFPDYREYSKYCEYRIIFSEFVALRSPKSKFEREGGVGGF